MGARVEVELDDLADGGGDAVGLEGEAAVADLDDVDAGDAGGGGGGGGSGVCGGFLGAVAVLSEGSCGGEDGCEEG